MLIKLHCGKFIQHFEINTNVVNKGLDSLDLKKKNRFKRKCGNSNSIQLNTK